MKILRNIIFFCAFIFVIPHSFVFANLQINEIMYDLKTGSDEGREWVEIYNDSNTPVDLSTYRFFEADTNHKIKLIQGSASIAGQGYALIVSDPIKFKTDWPNFAGIIYDSSFSLSNSGETLALKNALPDGSFNVVDQVAYNSGMGGAGDGNSLQKISGVWQKALPTPGEENKIVFIPPPLPKADPVPVKISILQNKAATKTEIGTDGKTSKIDKTVIPIQNTENNMADVVTEKGNSNSYFFVGLLALLVGVSGGAVYFIRKKKIILKNGDDFEILE